MIITRIEIDRFGGLADFQLELNDGVHVFYGDNGTGKSTLALFVRVMLYGMRNERRKETVPVRQRILPLGATSAAGRLVVEAKGRPLEISRSFGRTRRSDRLAMTWLDDGTSPATSQEPGEFILDINEETFVRTFFLGELGHAVLPGNVSQLNSRLMNLSVTGTEDMDYHQAMKRLKEEQRALASPRGAGSLDSLLVKEAELKASLAEARRLEEDQALLEQRLTEDRTEQLAVKQELEETLAGLESLEKLKELEDHEEAMLLLGRKTDLEQRIEKKHSPLTREQVRELKDRLDRYLEAAKALAREVSEHNEASRRLASREGDFTEASDRLFHPSALPLVQDLAARNNHLQRRSHLLDDLDGAGRGELERNLRRFRRAERNARRLNAPYWWLLPSPILLYLLYRGMVSESWLLAGGALLLLILGGLFFFRGRKVILERLQADSQVSRQEMERLAGPSAVKELLAELARDPKADLTALGSLWQAELTALSEEAGALGLKLEDLEEYLREQARYHEARASWQEGIEGLEETYRVLQGKVSELAEIEARLRADLRPAGLEPDEAGRSELVRLESRLEIRAEEERDLQEIMHRLDGLRLAIDLDPLLLEPQRLEGEELKAELTLKRRLKEQSEALKERLQALELGIIRKEEQLKAMAETIRTIQPEKALPELKAEIVRQKRRFEVLELAMANLEASFQEIQRDYLPRVSRRVSELFSQLTGGAYSEVILTGDYRMKVKLKGELVDMAYLSRGTLDLLWLGLRLALCDIITRGEKAPLIFDDSFIHLDQDRLQSILQVLNERIDGQIIILTCHHRESLLLKDMDRGH